MRPDVPVVGGARTRPARSTPGTSRRRRLAALVAVAAVAVVVGACAEITELSGLDAPPTVPAAAGDTTSTMPPTTGPTTTEPPPTTVAPTTPPPTTVPPTTVPDDTLERGEEGPEVAALQQRLSELGFYIPDVDGSYGSITEQAVLAFQKGAGLSRDGVAGPVTRAALDTAEPIGPREGGDHVEIDLARQLMFVVKGDATYIFNTSTGAPGMETPPGRFAVDREIDGMRHAPLGELWRPKYFNGGIALHGSNSIPGHAASHGCARLHNAIIDMIWEQNLVPIGTPVWVY